jgi:predicted chitinase
VSLHLTTALLAQATGCSPVRAELFAGPLAEACAAYHITATPERLAAFLAQIGHESASLRYVAEVWGPTTSQQRYEGRKDLGNTQSGDGSRYRGRGLIQTTGRANYAAVRDRLRRRLGPDVPDFEAEPEQLEHIRWAVWSAADYWDWRGLNALADAGHFEQITRRINGGLNGQPDRLARWKRAREALQLKPPAGIKDSLTPAPTPELKTMPLPAILGALLPTLIESVPKLGKLFGSGSEVAERNVKAAELAMQIAKDALGARNDQEAVELVKADPAAAAKAAEAIEARWLELTEAGGDGIAGARRENRAYADKDGPCFWLNPAFWISLLLLAMPIMLLVDVFFIHPESYVGEIRTQIVTGVLLVIGMVGGYWIGTSFSSARKSEMQTDRRP